MLCTSYLNQYCIYSHSRAKRKILPQPTSAGQPTIDMSARWWAEQVDRDIDSSLAILQRLFQNGRKDLLLWKICCKPLTSVSPAPAVRMKWRKSSAFLLCDKAACQQKGLQRGVSCQQCLHTFPVPAGGFVPHPFAERHCDELLWLHMEGEWLS